MIIQTFLFRQYLTPVFMVSLDNDFLKWRRNDILIIFLYKYLCRFHI